VRHARLNMLDVDSDPESEVEYKEILFKSSHFDLNPELAAIVRKNSHLTEDDYHEFTKPG
jgi:hypothetical protein